MIDAPHPQKPKSEAIDVGAQQVAALYAKAFLGAAEKSGQVDSLVQELNEFVSGVLDAFPELEAVIASALVSHEEKVQILDRVLGSKASPIVLDFLKVVTKHGRLDVLREIAGQALKQLDQLRGRVRVELRTATPLQNWLEGSVASVLGKLLGAEPKVDATVDPELIGGVVLRVGDTVYDGSVARQLRQVRDQMITRSVHEIQSRRDSFRHSGGN